MKVVYLFLFLCFLINAKANDKFPIYAEEDGEVKGEIEWENTNDKNTNVMDFQKYYKECMKDKFSIIKNESLCISYVTLSFIPNSNSCIVYYYEASEVIGENANYYVIKAVKKGDLIAYTNKKERLIPSIQKTNAGGCSK